MDILSWTKLNPNIRIQNVNKRFYGQYYYKLVVKITGSAFLRYPEVPIAEQASSRLNLNQQRTINFGGSWRYNRVKDPSSQDIELLEKVQTSRSQYPGVKIRVEEPWFQAYADNEDELYQFAQGIQHQNNQHIEAICRPQSDQQLDLIKQGYTVSQKITDFPIKVHVREGRYSIATKTQILTYLENIPDEACLPKHFRDSFSKSYESVWNCYFYIKDRDILTMIALICPTLVRTTEEYHLAPGADK